MCLKENDKTGFVSCPKCQGKGYTRLLKPKLEHIDIVKIDTEFKLLCMFCLGLGELDWIEAITGNKEVSIQNPLGEVFMLMHWIDNKLPKDNWAYTHHGSLYYITEKFFDKHSHIEGKMKNFIITFNDNLIHDAME